MCYRTHIVSLIKSRLCNLRLVLRASLPLFTESPRTLLLGNLVNRGSRYLDQAQAVPLPEALADYLQERFDDARAKLRTGVPLEFT